MFRAPTFHVRQSLFVKSNKITQATALYRHFFFQYCFSGRVFQRIFHDRHTIRRPFNSGFESEKPFFVRLFIQGRSHFIIGDELAGSAVKIDIALNTTQTPHVLTFQIGTGAPTIHFERHGILAFFDIVGDIPFGRGL